MEREISGSFQTLIASTSSAPITKLSSCGLAEAAAGTAAEGAEVSGLAEPALPLAPAWAQSPGVSITHNPTPRSRP